MQEDVLFQTDQPDVPEEAAPASQSEKYLLFLSDGLLFGVPAEAVVEIITGHAITKLPLVPSYIRGIINLRGQILPRCGYQTSAGSGGMPERLYDDPSV